MSQWLRQEQEQERAKNLGFSFSTSATVGDCCSPTFPRVATALSGSVLVLAERYASGPNKDRRTGRRTRPCHTPKRTVRKKILKKVKKK